VQRGAGRGLLYLVIVGCVQVDCWPALRTRYALLSDVGHAAALCVVVLVAVRCLLFAYVC